MHELYGAFEEPDSSYDERPLDRQYSFKENSPLYQYLQHKCPESIRNLGYYRLNFIILTLFSVIRREKLFDSRWRQIIVCDQHLQRALNRTWFTMNSAVRIILPHLDLHAKPHKTGKKLYLLSYRVETDAIISVLDWKKDN